MTLEENIHAYRMSPQAAELVRNTKLLLVAGIVGGGKNTVINELLKGSWSSPTACGLAGAFSSRSPKRPDGVSVLRSQSASCRYAEFGK
jgi:hypothetical protein